MTAADALARAFAILARDQPEAYARLGAQLRGLTLACSVDGEAFAVVGREHPEVAETVGRADGEASAGRDAIIELIDGERTILEMVMARRLALKADIRLMVRISRAQRAFAEGAVRSRAMRALLGDYRAGSPLTADARSCNGSSPR